jgi:hypothetical protein
MSDSRQVVELVRTLHDNLDVAFLLNHLQHVQQSVTF